MERKSNGKHNIAGKNSLTKKIGMERMEFTTNMVMDGG
jgi:hypothetical protein